MALNCFTWTICREFVDRNVTMNGLLPGPFDTDRIRSTIGFASKQTGKSFDELYEQRRMQNPARRFGTTEEFGKTCAFMCSAYAGFMKLGRASCRERVGK